MPNAVAPLVVQPSFEWYGNDGNWSTFVVRVGTPPQSFHVLPSTVGGEIWIPIPEGCSIYTFADCGASRGALPFNGSPSPGFQQNESTTWQELGIYALELEDNLFGPDDSALYGQDTISFGLSNGSFANVVNQSIAGIATSNFWLGSLGLGVAPATYDVRPQAVESLMTSLANSSLAISPSYGYSAGAAYHGAAGGLVFGGFDQGAFTPSGVDFDLKFSGSRSLTASLRSLTVSNTWNGTWSMPIGPYEMAIDSTVPELWLPRAFCDLFEAVLGLTYDNSTDLYLINETSRAQLVSRPPEFTFILATDATTGVTLNIVLPYAAFDQQLGPPWTESRIPYFPIRRAANESQFTLGRTFLQEAYIVTDWSRQTFTLGQSRHHNGVSNDIVPILPVESSSPGLGTGVIVGIAVGVAVAMIALCILGWWFWRRKQKKARASREAANLLEQYPGDMKDVDGTLGPRETSGVELETNERYELHEEQLKHQLMSEPVYELPGGPSEHELHGSRVEHELEGKDQDTSPSALSSVVAAQEVPEAAAKNSTEAPGTMDRFRTRFAL